jgi:hypothetical protein
MSGSSRHSAEGGFLSDVDGVAQLTFSVRNRCDSTTHRCDTTRQADRRPQHMCCAGCSYCKGWHTSWPDVAQKYYSLHARSTHSSTSHVMHMRGSNHSQPLLQTTPCSTPTVELEPLLATTISQDGICQGGRCMLHQTKHRIPLRTCRSPCAFFAAPARAASQAGRSATRAPAQPGRQGRTSRRPAPSRLQGRCASTPAASTCCSGEQICDVLIGKLMWHTEGDR